ncbi:MAG TPA: hypothetical protein VFB07_02380 [Vicinamibacterales bacterium]|nr:hypothetical protein [Vicinamibacterales bacterium]
MGLRISSVLLLSPLFAAYMPFCTPQIRPTMQPWEAPLASLWSLPRDAAARDLFNGPWGTARAPRKDDVYTLVEHKHHGVNPGMTVRDAKGRKWSVKQAPTDGQPAEGPIEVVLSRVLSAAGYHQPPVYFLPSFTLRDDWGTHVERGGRFRLHDKSLTEVGEWSWQQNPFVGMRPYQGLLVILAIFNSSDLKNSNNTLYEHRTGDFIERWYVVRDIGTALGESGRVSPVRGDPARFERYRFILDVSNGFVRFDYHGFHQELFRDRITPGDVGFACEMLAPLTDAQWGDAFRAGGYDARTADRFIRQVKTNIALGARIAGPDWTAGSSW